MRITLIGRPTTLDPIARGAPARLRYSGANITEGRTTGHWDRVTLLDGHAATCHEDWYQLGPLESGATYDVVVTLPPLAPGEYTLLLTLDGGSPGSAHSEHELRVPASTSPVSLVPARPSGG